MRLTWLHGTLAAMRLMLFRYRTSLPASGDGRIKRILATMLVLVPLAAQAQQPAWFYLDRLTRRCVPVDLAFPGALAPEDVRQEFVSRGLGGPWRVERTTLPSGIGAELTDGRTGRRFHFFSDVVLCLGFRNLAFGG